MEVDQYLVGHLLVAMPGLEDPNFARSVTLVCEHTAEGAFGIVINQEMEEVRLGEVFSHLGFECHDDEIIEQPIYRGGPVQLERGFVIHRPPGTWEATLRVTDQLALASSLDILGALSRGQGPDDALVAFGYAGWGPGQLEDELANNAWLSVPVEPQVIFRVNCETRWHAAAGLLGIDLNLVATAGHA